MSRRIIKRRNDIADEGSTMNLDEAQDYFGEKFYSRPGTLCYEIGKFEQYYQHELKEKPRIEQKKIMDDRIDKMFEDSIFKKDQSI